jgi:hypothetical protein
MRHANMQCRNFRIWMWRSGQIALVLVTIHGRAFSAPETTLFVGTVALQFGSKSAPWFQIKWLLQRLITLPPQRWGISPGNLAFES